MTANELRKMYIDFYKHHMHAEIPSASLLPSNDPSVLFTTAGMHPLVPFLLGENHPLGKRLVNCQKCIRTGDIDEVGNDTHLTFFEMLGNWSLGDYFKADTVKWSHEFITKALGFPQDKIAVTVFKGSEIAPRDTETEDAWRALGYPEDRIFFYDKSENWWGLSTGGPCGPCSEMFYVTDKPQCSIECGPACNCGKYIEIGNNVFMEYNHKGDEFIPLLKKNVDVGLGFERLLCLANGAENVYETELFTPILSRISELSGKTYNTETQRAYRIIADHLRAATFILGDDKLISPSNTDAGYILRRLIRRAYRYLSNLDAPANSMSQIAQVVIDNYSDVYPELKRNAEFIKKSLNREEELFGKTLTAGIKMAKKYLDASEKNLSAEDAFRLYDTFGFPLEFTTELAAEHDIKVDTDGFYKLYAEHQEKSRAGAAGKFTGGLADDSAETTRLHTAAHLMLGALRKILGDTVVQRGSNITSERLRFDFSFDRKVERAELDAVEKIVQAAIDANIDIECNEMAPDVALDAGAVGTFGDKYGDVVRVWRMGEFSHEICGGPHDANTGELGKFKIQKEESSAAGVRRIKAVLV